MERTASNAVIGLNKRVQMIQPHMDLSPSTSRPFGPEALKTSATVNISHNSRKRRREKYVAKACEACKRSKIKCDGEFPCAPCVRRRRRCYTEGTAEEITDNAQGSRRNDIPNHRLQERVAMLEAQLESVTQALPPQMSSTSHQQSRLDEDLWQAESSQLNPEVIHKDNPTDPKQMFRCNSAESSKDHSCRLAFASSKRPTVRMPIVDTSASNVLQRVEDQLNEPEIEILENSSAFATPPMTPLPSGLHGTADELPRYRINRALRVNGITPVRNIWDDYLKAYMLEVHPMHQFLHEPSIMNMYDRLWETISPCNNGSSQELQALDLSIHVLLVLAIGCCALSSRVQIGDDLHSAGWSLYSIAKDLQGDLLDVVSNDSKPLQSLHSLTLISLYLLRIDATEMAQKVLSLAVTHAYHLGVHQEKALGEMEMFEKEMLRRVWWCIYILDRRLSLALGRPFLIQDMNVTTELPTKQLGSSISSSPTRGGLEDCNPEVETIVPTSLDYLIAMVGYSRLIGKIWETLFRAESSDQSTNIHLYEYLEGLIESWYASVPKSLICDTYNLDHTPQNDLTDYHFKQRFLIKVRYHYIIILISVPLRRVQNESWDDGILSATICLQHARTIVEMFAQSSPSDGVYGFPYLPYLFEATITILACLTKLPHLKESYRLTTESGLNMLNQFSKKTWVSGKMARMIYKLNYIAPHLLSTDQRSTHGSFRSSLVGSSCTTVPDCGVSGKKNAVSTRTDLEMTPMPTQQHPVETNGLGSDTFAPQSNITGDVVMDPNQPMSLVQSMEERPVRPEDDMMASFQPSMIADLPFEFQFGNNSSQRLPHSTYITGDNDNIGQIFGHHDIDWLDRMISQDASFMDSSWPGF